MEQQELMSELAAAYEALHNAKRAAEDASMAIDRIESLVPDSMNNELESVRYPTEIGAFEIKFKNSWAPAFMARTFVSILDAIPAKNYVEVSYVLDDKPLLVTIHRPDGEKPSARADRLQADVEALKSAGRRLLNTGGANHGTPEYYAAEKALAVLVLK